MILDTEKGCNNRRGQLILVDFCCSWIFIEPPNRPPKPSASADCSNNPFLSSTERPLKDNMIQWVHDRSDSLVRFLDRIAGLLERGYDSTQAWGKPRETAEASFKRKIKVTLALYFIDILYRQVEISVCNQFNSTHEKRPIIYTRCTLGFFTTWRFHQWCF